MQSREMNRKLFQKINGKGFTSKSEKSNLIQKIKECRQNSEILTTPNNNHIEYISQYTQKFLNSYPSQKAIYDDDLELLNDQNIFKISDEKTQNIEEIIQNFDKLIVNQGLNTDNGGFMAFVNGGSIPAAGLGDYMVATVNPFAATKKANPGAFQMEKSLFEWVGGLVGYPKDCGGNFTTGGSMSTLSAVCAARDSKKIKAKDYEKCVIYVSTQTHICYRKSLHTAGMGESISRVINTDKNFKMDCQELEKQIETDIKNNLIPLMVIGTAGATNTGQIDPLQKIGEICQKHNIWFNVDGAYGGFFSMCDSVKEKFKGIELSDSVILDPHKTLHMPLGLGLILTKDVKHLYNTFSIDNAEYMKDGDTLIFQDYPESKDLSNELSKGFRSFKMWMSLKLYGEKTFKNDLQEKLLLAQYLIHELQKIENIKVVIPDPDLSIVCFRYENEDLLNTQQEQDAFNEKLNNYFQKDQNIFLSSTFLNGQFTLRTCIISSRTHQEHIELVLQYLQQGIDELLKDYK